MGYASEHKPKSNDLVDIVEMFKGIRDVSNAWDSVSFYIPSDMPVLFRIKKVIVDHDEGSVNCELEPILL